jgi:hypothetical protein
MIDAILKTTAVRGTAPAPKLGATAAQPTGSGGATGAAAGAGGAVAGGSHGIMHAVASAVKSVTGKPIAGVSRAAACSLPRGWLYTCSRTKVAARSLASRVCACDHITPDPPCLNRAGSQVHRADFKPASLAGLRLGVPRKHYYDADPGVLQVVEVSCAERNDVASQ